MQIVDFDYHAVDLVVERLATVLPLGARRHHFVDGAGTPVVGVGLKTPLAKRFEDLPLRPRLPTLSLAQGIDEHVEWPFRGDARVELADRSRGAVARVGEQRLPGGGAFVVDLLERRLRQIHLTPHLEIRRRTVVQRERHAANRPQVGGDVLALRAIAACGANAEAAPLVAQHDRQPVDLRLDGEVLDVATQQPRDPFVPGAQRVGRERVGQTQHRHPMLNHRELRGRTSADALGG